MENFVHTLFKPKFDAVKELKRLHQELRELEELKSLSNTKGWKQLKGWVIDKVVQYDQSIVTLSDDVDKNKKQIEHKKAFRDALLWMINQIDFKLKAELDLHIRIKFLAETAHDLEPRDFVNSGVELQGEN